VVSVALMIIK
jgi:hypothetical protein